MAADLANLRIRVDALEAQNAARDLDKLAASGAKAESSTNKLAASMGALAGILGVAALAKMAEESVMLAARYETLGVVMGVLGNNAGFTRAQMDEFQASLQETGISMVAARDALNMMAAAQLDLSKASQLARAAQDAAVIAGINSSEAFQRMTRGIQSGELEILKTMGIMVSWEDGYKRLAPTIGKTVDTLTAHEKALLRQQIVLDDAQKKAGAYEASMGTAGKQMQSMKRYVEDLQVKFGLLFQPALTALVFDLSKGIKDVGEGLSKWADENAGSVREFVDSITIAAREVSQLVGDVGRLGTSMAQTGVETSAFARVLQGIALLVFGIDATVRALAGTFAQFTAWMLRNFTTPFLEAENSLRRMAKIAQMDLVFNKAAGGVRSLDAKATQLDMFGSEQGETVAARWEKLMQSLENAGVAPKVKAITDAVKDQKTAISEASAEAKKHAQALASMVEKYREERAAIGLSSDIIERLKAQKLGASEATLRFIATVQDEKNAFDSNNEALKKQVELREKLHADAMAVIDMQPERPEMLPSQQRILEDARMLGLDTETPEERTARRLKELNQMLQTGAIPSLEAYRRRWIELQMGAGGALEHIGIAMNTVTNQMGQAFANFVTTGKLQFKDLVSSILADLARLYAQKAFSQLLMMGINAVASYYGAPSGGSAAAGGSSWGNPGGGGAGDWGMAQPGGGTEAAFAGGRSAPAAGSVSTSIVINVAKDGAVSSKAQGDGEGWANVGRLIDGKVRQILVDEMRPNGLLNPGRA